MQFFSSFQQKISKQKLGRIMLTHLFLLLICYFLFHAVSGDRGWLAQVQLEQQLNRYHSELDLVRAERINLEHRVNNIGNETLDLDLLDEQARLVLGYSGRREVMVYTGNR